MLAYIVAIVNVKTVAKQILKKFHVLLPSKAPQGLTFREI
jgi:hypothetical protein